MRSRSDPVTEISLFETEISVTRLKIFPYEHSASLGDLLDKIASLAHHCCQNGVIFVVDVFPLQKCAN